MFIIINFNYYRIHPERMLARSGKTLYFTIVIFFFNLGDCDLDLERASEVTFTGNLNLN